MIESSIAEPIITPFQTYLILQLDSISSTCAFLSVMLGFILGICVLIKLITENDYYLKTPSSIQGIIRKGTFLFCIFVLLAAFLPSSKNMAATIIIQHIVNNQEVQKLPQELLGLLKDLIQEWTSSSLETHK